MIKFLASRRFLLLILAFFIFESVWIALSGLYPMAFDENFHLGIIKLYTNHISPFWANQPAGADKYGAVNHDPSYLYQYLMSFIYRLINIFTNNQTVIVIILRFIDIALFTWGLTLFRKLMLKIGTSKLVINLSLLIFVFVPIVPFLAAQINYDDLLIPLVALSLIWTLDFDKHLSNANQLNIKLLIKLTILCLLSSLVKYAFLPILLSIFIFVAIRLWQHKSSFKSLHGDWRKTNLFIKAALITLLVLSGSLFIQRYGVNVIKYHTPVPDCGQVLTVRKCDQYEPWARDHYLSANNPQPQGPLVFSADWFYGMWLRSFFAVAGPSTDFQTRGPLILPSIGAIVFAVIGLIAILLNFKYLIRRYTRPNIWLLIATALCYIGFLWIDEYKAYNQTGQAVAINGRYLLPVLLPLIVLAASAFAHLPKINITTKKLVASIAFLCLIWGGGALTFILRSNNSWLWPNSFVQTVNKDLRHSVGPAVPGYRSPLLFL